MVETRASIKMINFLKNENIDFFTTSSSYINRNRVIDRAIRTIRDILGEDNFALFDIQKVTEAVAFYNARKHRAFNYDYSPAEVQANLEIEEYYIRENIYRLEEAVRRQYLADYYKYIPGNILLIHLDTTKYNRYPYYDPKVRRKFNRLARFMNYENGNVRCTVLYLNGDEGIDWNPHRSIVLPIYHTKFLCADEEDIPFDYKKLVI